ncbi:MAG TPA: hypothetical protein VK960_08655 [Acidimicrobiia bacterium]|nr:hypothetical protein [Acidimicrobiia bacterium]
MRPRLAALLLLAGILAGCAGDEGRVTGVLTDVEGDLTGIESFELLTAGERIRFVPEDGLDVFGDDGTPLSHLHEHLQTGDPVRVTYRVDGNSRVAILVEDA